MALSGEPKWIQLVRKGLKCPNGSRGSSKSSFSFMCAGSLAIVSKTFNFKTWHIVKDIQLYCICFQIQTYPGGGYIVTLSTRKAQSEVLVAELEANRWLDRQTRAVMVEYASYNPQIDLFCFTTIVAEIPTVGGIVRYNTVQTFRLVSSNSATCF